MQPDKVQPIDIRKQVARLFVAFPGKRTSAEMEALASELRQHVSWWTPAEFEQAITTCIATCKFFPRVADILRERPAQQKPGADAPDGADVCRACGQLYLYRGYQQGILRGKPRVVIGRLRCDCPKNDPGWETLEASEWRGGNLPAELVHPKHREPAGTTR